MDLKAETAKKLRSLGIDEATTFTLFDSGLIDERTAKKFLVRKEYEQMNTLKGNKNQIKEQLADKFCVSFETIKNYINRK